MRMLIEPVSISFGKLLVPVASFTGAIGRSAIGRRAYTHPCAFSVSTFRIVFRNKRKNSFGAIPELPTVGNREPRGTFSGLSFPWQIAAVCLLFLD